MYIVQCAASVVAGPKVGLQYMQLLKCWSCKVDLEFQCKYKEKPLSNNFFDWIRTEQPTFFISNMF